MKPTIPASVIAVVLALGPLAASPAATPDVDVHAGWFKPGPPPLEHFIKPLDLDADQQKKLQPIFADAQATAAADDETGGTRTPTSEAAIATRAMREADLRVRLATVLTAGQLARYEQLTAAHSARAPKQHSHPAHGHSDMNSSSSSR